MTTLLNKQRLNFLDYLDGIRGYSQLSIKSYNEAIVEALKLSDIYEEDGFIVINLMPLRLHVKQQSPKTISKKLSSIRSFVKYLHNNSLHVKLMNDDSIKVPSSLPKPISNKYIEDALHVADDEERLIVTMIYTLGLRISELSNIKLCDIKDEWITVLGKGNKYRNVPLLKITADLITDYCSKKSQTTYLFEKENVKLSENSIRYKINKLFKKIGLKVTPHQLRHSYATELLNADARISDVSELLGHKSMATTQVYTKLSSSLKLRSYANAHPLCKGIDEDTQ